MPTMVQGVRGTGTASTESRLARDVAPAMLRLEPDETPLTTLLGKIASKGATDPKVEWFEDELNPRWDKLGASLTAGAATMTVVNYKRFRAGDVVKINNAEVVYVSATPTTTAVAITRAQGSTGAAAASLNDGLLILGNCFEEGAARGALLSTQRAGKFNYCQIIKTPFGVTNTQDNTKTLAGQDKAEEKAKKLIEHKRSIEQSAMFGERGIDSTGTHPRRLMGGVLEYIDTNVKDMGGTMTEPEWEDFLRLCFRYGSREKVVLCSPKVIGVINGFARGRLQTKSVESFYGMTMTQYQNAGRKVMLVEHVLLTNDSLSDLTGIAGYAICLDLKNVKLRYMRGMLVGYEQGIQDKGDDEVIDQYISEVSLEFGLEKTHGLATGITD